MPEGFEFFAFDDLPQPIKDEIEKHRMEHETSQHEFKHFWDSLDEQQLKMLRRLFTNAANESHAAAFYSGLAVAQLDSRHEVCLGCGEKHSEQLKKLVSDESKTDEPEPEPEKIEPGTPAYAIACSKYTVVPTGENHQVKCVKCGFEYVSLEDRMRRKPDECTGCIHQAKWG